MRKLTTEEFIKKAKEIHGNKYDYSKVEYVNNRTKVCLICAEHGEFEQQPNNHLNSQGCAKCGIKSYTSDTKEFIEKAKELHGNKYDYSKVGYKDNKKVVIIICPIHGEFEQAPVNHLQGAGCPSCGGTKNLSTEEFIEKAKEIHGDKYDYSKVNYVNNKEIVIIICPIHGDFEQKPNSHLNGHGCTTCNESKLEKYTAKLLDDNNITYERQKRFEWRGRQSLDFYLPDYQIAIECQGRQHFEPSSFGSKKENTANELFKIIKKRDKRKLKLCKKHNIKMIYINHFDSDEDIENKIKNIII